MSLDHDADSLIQTLAREVGNKTRIVVLIQAPGAVIISPWIDLVDAAAIMFLGGQQTGDAWRNVLFGAYNPTGRLPIMMPISENDTISPGQGSTVTYDEGMMTSYRNKNFNYTFPFGFGLSFTSFEFSNLTCETNENGSVVVVRIDVTNTGKMAGRSVPQLYVLFPNNPTGLLKGFQRTNILQPGETQRQIEFPLRDIDLSFWKAGEWNRVSNSELVIDVGAFFGDVAFEFTLSQCQ